MNIRSIRKPITAVLSLVLICDLLLAYKLWNYKPWKNIVDQDDGVVGNFTVVSAWGWIDLLLISLVTVFQIGLIYLTYKAWATKSEDCQCNPDSPSTP